MSETILAVLVALHFLGMLVALALLRHLTQEYRYMRRGLGALCRRAGVTVDEVLGPRR